MAPKKCIIGEERRVFTEEDDLTILKAIPKFMSETGDTPYSTDFHTFVKNKIRDKITVKQLNRKIHSFKGKYGKEGETFTKTHEKKALKLFMKIDWGTNNGSKSGIKSTEMGLEHQIAQVKLYIDQVKFIKDQAVLMAQELRYSLD
jgi:hypothetical protein